MDQAVSAIAGDMARMHEAYALQGVDSGTCRMAIATPDDAAKQKIAAAVEALGRSRG